MAVMPKITNTKELKIIAVELTKEARRYDDLQPADFPCCLILGNELVGISDEVLNFCDDAIMIPMYGVKHSLNVAVAAGIVAFEAVRKLEGHNEGDILP